MRARVILYNSENDAILLIHRLKNGRDYWVIPGGGAKGNETPVETAIREINEELSIQLKPAALNQLFEYKSQEDEHFFYAEISFIAAPEISGEEKERSNNANVYQPDWVAVKDLTQINLMPPKIACKIINLIWLIWQKSYRISYYSFSNV